MALNKKEIAVFEKMEMWQIAQLLQTGINLKLVDWEKVTDTLEWMACKPCAKCATIPHTPGTKPKVSKDDLLKVAEAHGWKSRPREETIAPGGSNAQ